MGGFWFSYMTDTIDCKHLKPEAEGDQDSRKMNQFSKEHQPCA